MGFAKKLIYLFSIDSALFAQKHPGVDSPCTVVFSSAQVLDSNSASLLSLFLHSGFDNSFVCKSYDSSCVFSLPLSVYKLAGWQEFVLSNAGAKMSAVFSVWAVRSGASGAASAAVCFSTFMSDDAKALAQRLKHRDPELLDRLIEQYQFRLFRYLLHLTANRERAEDFFQETWLRVLERGHQYDGKWKFEAWLFAIARNLVLDWHRRKKPQSIDSLAGPEEHAEFDIKDERGESPLDQVLQAEQKFGVQQSLEKVPAIYREVLVLRFQEEMQLDEISGVTGAPISTVKSRLYRGLGALKAAMQGGAA